MLTHGPGAWILGNWGVNGVLTYSKWHAGRNHFHLSAATIGHRRPRRQPYVTSYTNWQPQWKNGSFDPSNDFFLNGRIISGARRRQGHERLRQ